MKKILVTGGTGYIGSHTVVELLNLNHQVSIIDNLSNSKITVLDKIEQITHKKPNFHQVDLLNLPALKKVFQTEHFDLIIHFAGLKAVAESVQKPILYYENNITGTINLLKCMEEFNINQIIFSSSATVYGELNIGKLDESMETGRKITSPYGETKHTIEKILESKAKTDPNFSTVILRYFNPVGAHPSGLLGEDPNGIPNNLMPVIMRVHQGKIPTLSIFGNDYPTRDGTCIRDYIHVVDLAKGHLAAIPALEKTNLSIYNLGTGLGTSVLEMVNAFNKASNSKIPHQISPRRPGDLPEFFASADKAAKELHWRTEKTINDAMHDTLNFLKHNQ